MTMALVVGAKMLLAGVFVAAISQLSTALKPKLFAGLFAAAPSVAAASMIVTSLDKPREVEKYAQGMIAGSAGMLACCLAAMLLVPRLRALLASGVGWVAWAAGAAAAYLGIWR